MGGAAGYLVGKAVKAGMPECDTDTRQAVAVLGGVPAGAAVGAGCVFAAEWIFMGCGAVLLGPALPAFAVTGLVAGGIAGGVCAFKGAS
jgi:hypothetical protein